MTPFGGVSPKTAFSYLPKPKIIWRIFLGVLHRYAMGQWGVWLVRGLGVPGLRVNGWPNDVQSFDYDKSNPNYGLCLVEDTATQYVRRSAIVAGQDEP
jgi:hypothetical protein